jgi:hypothetical protein
MLEDSNNLRADNYGYQSWALYQFYRAFIRPFRGDTYASEANAISASVEVIGGEAYPYHIHQSIRMVRNDKNLLILLRHSSLDEKQTTIECRYELVSH